MTAFSKLDRAAINRILGDPDDGLFVTLEQMRHYARHRAAEVRQKQKEGRKEAAKVTAAGRRFLAELAVVDPIGGARPVDVVSNRNRLGQSPRHPQTGEPSGSMFLVYQRGGDHGDILAADRAVRRVLVLLRPASGRGGRSSKVTYLENVIRDLAAIYRRRTRRRPTSSPAGDFALLVTIVTRLQDPKDEIAAALSRKPWRKP